MRREWSPTSTTPCPVAGVFHVKESNPRTVSYEVRSRIRCDLALVSTEQVGRVKRQSHSAVARLQFRRGKEQSVPKRACLEQRRRVKTRVPHTGLPSIERELSDCLPKRAPSPGPKSCSSRGELHWAEGLVRLVLRCCHCYTTCSSSNPPSSE